MRNDGGQIQLTDVATKIRKANARCERCEVRVKTEPKRMLGLVTHCRRVLDLGRAKLSVVSVYMSDRDGAIWVYVCEFIFVCVVCACGLRVSALYINLSGVSTPTL